MTINSELITSLQQQLTKAQGSTAEIEKVNTVSGGSINDAYCLQTSTGKYMLKLNNQAAYPQMFRLEAEGLKTIAATGAIATPQVIADGGVNDQSFLLLEWVETGTKTPAASAMLGQQLAAMHRHTAPQFGLDYNNYMGSLPQSNTKHTTWSNFFTVERLIPMVRIGERRHLLTPADLADFERLYQRLPNLFNEEAPALLHGDLWSGNYLISAEGRPYLIDPAVSYGLREFDIAMTTLFGGFSQGFYDAYSEAFPLNSGWQQRLPLWNLYPLLLHLNLFGTSYLGQVRSALKSYL